VSGGADARGAARDEGWMRAALGLARRGLGRVWPNPAVGCVIVNGAAVVGRGRTADGGRPHAEALALAQAGARARGGTVYTTLEPCAHTGLTPPCTAALVAAGVARVVVAAEDPDPRVNGAGVAALREAGLRVDVGCLAAEAVAVNLGFLTRMTAGRPMVTLKMAASLDGRIATGTGESRWITGPRARAEVHLMRAQSDAVLVGAGTVRSDDPKLNVRGLGIEDAHPVRVVVSGALSLPRDGYLAQTAREVPLWLCHDDDAEESRRAAWSELGAELIEVPFNPDAEMDLPTLLQLLGGRGLTRVLCEGGGRLAAALIEADLVDEIVCYTAGVVLGDEAIPVVGGLEVEALQLAPRFRLLDVAPIGPDLRSRWRRRA
jgi:diaminohydroxyphosphoribosylaminopyrimidine deaminase/5-amino-6-(5-phosphoribosylamino)uracil reductase